MMQLINSIATSKDDVVFVGSVSLWFSKLIDGPHDIDIVVHTLDGLEAFGKIETWDTKSPMSISEKRAGIIREDYTIDIFIEPVLPEHSIIDGVKVQTLDNLKNHLDRCINISEGPRKDVFIQRRKFIDYLIQK